MTWADGDDHCEQLCRQRAEVTAGAFQLVDPLTLGRYCHHHGVGEARQLYGRHVVLQRTGVEDDDVGAACRCLDECRQLLSSEVVDVGDVADADHRDQRVRTVTDRPVQIHSGQSGDVRAELARQLRILHVRVDQQHRGTAGREPCGHCCGDGRGTGDALGAGDDDAYRGAGLARCLGPDAEPIHDRHEFCRQVLQRGRRIGIDGGRTGQGGRRCPEDLGDLPLAVDGSRGAGQDDRCVGAEQQTGERSEQQCPAAARCNFLGLRSGLDQSARDSQFRADFELRGEREDLAVLGEQCRLLGDQIGGHLLHRWEGSRIGVSHEVEVGGHRIADGVVDSGELPADGRELFVELGQLGSLRLGDTRVERFEVGVDVRVGQCSRTLGGGCRGGDRHDVGLGTVFHLDGVGERPAGTTRTTRTVESLGNGVGDGCRFEHRHLSDDVAVGVVGEVDLHT